MHWYVMGSLASQNHGVEVRFTFILNNNDTSFDSTKVLEVLRKLVNIYSKELLVFKLQKTINSKRITARKSLNPQ